MAELLLHPYGKFGFNSIHWKAKRVSQIRRPSWRPYLCALIEDNHRTLVKNGNSSIDICRVVNGMWQTSGGWGRIDREDAVDAMVRYADSGLNTFDLADICNNTAKILSLLSVSKRPLCSILLIK